MSDVAPLVSPPPRTLPPLARPLIGLAVMLTLFAIVLESRGDLDLLTRPITWQNMLHLHRGHAVVALGLLLVIITGGIDLSVGSVAALTMVVTMQTYNDVWRLTGSPMNASMAAIVVGLLTGAACGACNGLAISFLRISPFVATLGMMSVARGLAMWVSGRSSVSFKEGARPGWLEHFDRAWSDHVLIDPGVWSVVLLAVVVAVLLRYTVFGRYCYAIGSNEATAELCGLPVTRCKVAVYTLSGLFAGWAGVLLFAKNGSGDPNVAPGLELEAIAAVVLGGASLAGGRGGVSGTVLGVLLLALLERMIGLVHAPVELKHILVGVVLVVYTAINQWQRKGSD